MRSEWAGIVQASRFADDQNGMSRPEQVRGNAFVGIYGPCSEPPFEELTQI